MSRDRLRTALLAAALAAVILVPLAIWGATSLSEDESATLVVETYPGPSPEMVEFVVALPDEELNTPETTDGAPTVGVECLDAEGRVEFRVDHPFPFSDTDGGLEPPHVHQRVGTDQLAAIETCRLDGTTVELEGAPDAAAPDASPAL